MASDPSWWRHDSSWWAKADRAGEHLRSLRKQVDDFKESDPFTVDPEPTDNPDRTAYRLHIHRPVPVAISTTVGDVLHNLRSALDNLAFEVGRRSAGRPLTTTEEEACGFPVCREPNDFVRYFQARGRGAVYNNQAQAALRSVQPFAIAEESIKLGVPRSFADDFKWDELNRLRILSNIDKHHHLPAAAFWPSFVFWMSDTQTSNRRYVPAPYSFVDGAILGHMVGRDPDKNYDVVHEFNLVLKDDPVYDLNDPGCNAPDLVDLLEGWHSKITTLTFGSVFGAM